MKLKIYRGGWSVKHIKKKYTYVYENVFDCDDFISLDFVYILDIFITKYGL